MTGGEKPKKTKKKKCTAAEKLIADGWFADVSEMRPWIMARQVLINDTPVSSPSEKIDCDAVVRIKEYYKRKYVNKGGLKLEHALKSFGVDPKGRVALDCGASTGGFTDCLIGLGASKVYAVDAGFGQLAEKLLHEPRVVNMEKTNLGDAVLKALSPKPSLVTLDLSYLSLRTAFGFLPDILAPGGEVVALVKPIFEVDSAEIRRSGDINDAGLHRDLLASLCESLAAGWQILSLTYSPVRGNSGVIEYFLHAKASAAGGQNGVSLSCIAEAVITGFSLKKFDKSTAGESGNP